jgi:site-specific recombinase XerC
MRSTGLRVSEASGFTLKEPHLPRNLPEYIASGQAFDSRVCGKGRKVRIVEIPGEVFRLRPQSAHLPRLLKNH